MNITQNSTATCEASSPAGSSADWMPVHDARSGVANASAAKRTGAEGVCLQGQGKEICRVQECQASHLKLCIQELQCIGQQCAWGLSGHGTGQLNASTVRRAPVRNFRCGSDHRRDAMRIRLRRAVLEDPWDTRSRAPVGRVPISHSSRSAVRNATRQTFVLRWYVKGQHGMPDLVPQQKTCRRGICARPGWHEDRERLVAGAVVAEFLQFGRCSTGCSAVEDM